MRFCRVRRGMWYDEVRCGVVWYGLWVVRFGEMRDGEVRCLR